MRIKETKLYTYDELSDEAKARARDWWREASAGDNFFAEYVTDSFHEELAALGFTVDKKTGLQWSGFWSQGDGAGFAGTWRASDFDPAALLADRPATWPAESGGHECPSNKELHRIAAELRNCKDAGASWAKVSCSRGFFMRADEFEWSDETPEGTDLDAIERRFIEAARDLAHAFYKALEAEHDYQNSDEQVAEAIDANGYEFTEDGACA